MVIIQQKVCFKFLLKQKRKKNKKIYKIKKNNNKLNFKFISTHFQKMQKWNTLLTTYLNQKSIMKFNKL